jgi:hypothetical protein
MEIKCEPGVPGPHLWSIEPADRDKHGSASPGRCQNCGWVKGFENSIATSDFRETSALIYAETNSSDDLPHAGLNF